jgi:anti-sigma factor RsiW
MNDDCVHYEDDLAELALGVLTGRERARALSHLESCPRCSEELEQLARAADAIVAMAPEAEPPLGFETRLFERMGIPAARATRRRRPRFWIPATVAAGVAALAVGLGLGLSSSPAPTTSAHGVHEPVAALTAALVENGQNVGRVDVFGGAKPWMQMTLDDSTARGVVHCMVVTDDGQVHVVGSFVSTDGYGAWAAPLHVKPASVRSAQVMSASGTVIATATLG